MPARAVRSRFIALLGYGDAEARLRAREAGFDQHLVKPGAPDDLKTVPAVPGPSLRAT